MLCWIFQIFCKGTKTMVFRRLRGRNKHLAGWGCCRWSVVGMTHDSVACQGGVAWSTLWLTTPRCHPMWIPVWFLPSKDAMKPPTLRGSNELGGLPSLPEIEGEEEIWTGHILHRRRKIRCKSDAGLGFWIVDSWRFSLMRDNWIYRAKYDYWSDALCASYHHSQKKNCFFI